MKQAQVLTEKDTKRVLTHIARKTYAARNRCMLELSWLSGMRNAKSDAVLKPMKQLLRSFDCYLQA